MTWTSISPQFDKYADCDSPKAVADVIFGGNDEWRRFANISHVVDTTDSPDDPWNYIIDNDEWMTFWKPVYDLKNKPRLSWTDDEALSYFAMDLCVNNAIVGAGLRQ